MYTVKFAEYDSEIITLNNYEFHAKLLEMFLLKNSSENQYRNAFVSESQLDPHNNGQSGCIVEGKAHKSPLFWRFSWRV